MYTGEFSSEEQEYTGEIYTGKFSSDKFSKGYFSAVEFNKGESSARAVLHGGIFGHCCIDVDGLFVLGV